MLAPELAVAVAEMVIWAGAVKELPEVGEVIATCGATGAADDVVALTTVLVADAPAAL